MTGWVRELCVKYKRLPTERRYAGIALTDPDTVGSLVAELIGDAPQERFIALFVDVRLRLLSYSTIAIGSVDQCAVHPSQIFQGALLVNAHSVILAHNHPSGDPTPSVNDDVLTARLVEAGRLIGIEILDHVVVGGLGASWSYAAEGRFNT